MADSAVGRVRDGVPSGDCLIDLNQRASGARNGAGRNVLEFLVDRTARADGCGTRAGVGVATGILGQGAGRNNRTRGAAKCGRDRRRRGRLAGQKVNAADGVLKAAIRILRVDLIDDQGDFVVLVPNDGGLTGSQLPLRRFKRRIQAAAEGRVDIRLHARKNGGFCRENDAGRGKLDCWNARR